MNTQVTNKIKEGYVNGGELYLKILRKYIPISESTRSLFLNKTYDELFEMVHNIVEDILYLSKRCYLNTTKGKETEIDILRYCHELKVLYDEYVETHNEILYGILYMEFLKMEDRIICLEYMEM
nr:MAG TPA: hypothetical protein [Caudoviricetes sp.]